MTPEVDLSSELAEARRRVDELESLVEISPVAIVVMDADERVTGWNPAAAQLFGYSPQEAIGRPIQCVPGVSIVEEAVSWAFRTASRWALDRRARDHR